jgi:hypothetical protein
MTLSGDWIQYNMIYSIKINSLKRDFPFNIIILEEIRKIKKSNIAQITESIYNRQERGDGLEGFRGRD